MSTPAATQCPTCFGFVYLTADGCWRCGRLFEGGELWKLYQEGDE